MHVVFCALLLIPAWSMNIPVREVAPGVQIPVVSIGSGQVGPFKHASATEIVGNWLELGGRGIDTAWIYSNQAEIAQTIKQHNVARKDLFITTKLLECVTGPEHYIDADLRLLNTSYVDLMLIHAPVGNCAHTWSVLEDYHRRGVLRAIGVSNFNKKNLQGLLKTAKITPAVNQIQYNVFSHDEETIQFCRQANITVEAYSPLGGWTGGKKKSVFSDPTIKGIASAHKVSEAQIALKWILQRGDILTFLSANKTHQANDADIFDPKFQLTAEQMTSLDKLSSTAVIV